jgi:hypothetical protein
MSDCDISLCYAFEVRVVMKGNNMKKIILSLVAVAALSTPVFAKGVIYENSTEPSTLSLQTQKACKVGTATCKNYFGLVQIGDCSYEAAMKNGKITQVHHHDNQVKGWFFLKRQTTKVYGE